MAEILDTKGRAWRPWRFYSESNPNLSLLPFQIQAFQYGYITLDDIPLDGDRERPTRRLCFNAGAADVHNARLAAALALTQPGIKPGQDWYSKLTAAMREAEQPTRKKGKENANDSV